MSTAEQQKVGLLWPPDSRFLHLLSLSTDAIFVFNQLEECVWSNAAAQACTSADNAGGRNLTSVLSMLDSDERRSVLVACRSPHDSEVSIREVTALVLKTSDGRFLLQLPAPLFNEGIGTVTEIIAAQSLPEDDLGTTEERDRLLIEVMPQFVWLGELDGTIVYINQYFRDYTNCSLADINNGAWLRLVHPDDVAAVTHSIYVSVRDREPLEVEYRIRRISDGQYRWHLARARLYDRARGGQSWLGTAVDVHELRRAEHELLRSQEWQKVAVTAGQIGLWDWDIIADHVEWSDRVYDLHGLKPGTFGGTAGAFVSLIHPADVETVSRCLSDALIGLERYRVEFRTIHQESGEVLWLSTEGEVLFDSANKPIRMVGAVVDATERKQYEQALYSANEELRLVNSDLQQFAYAAAHDLQEPLRNITLYTQLLKRRHWHLLDEAGQHHVEVAFQSAQRMRRLVEDLLAYTRVRHGNESEPDEALDFSQLVSDACMNVDALIAQSGAVVDIDPSLPRIRANRSRMMQLVQNLLSNSIKYRRPDVPPRITVRSFKGDGDVNVFEFGDNGIGIAPEYQEKIFGLFRRLHGPEIEGTGIGLALCRRIVEQEGGRIWVESTGEGDGATFRFTLPQAVVGKV